MECAQWYQNCLAKSACQECGNENGKYSCYEVLSDVRLRGWTITIYSQDCHQDLRGLCLQSHLENPGPKKKERNAITAKIDKEFIFAVFSDKELSNRKYLFPNL